MAATRQSRPQQRKSITLPMAVPQLKYQRTSATT